MEVLGKNTSETITYEEFRRWACLAPDWQLEVSPALMLVGWMRGSASVAKAVRRGGEGVHPIADPRQQFVVFDLLLRASMAGTLAFMVLVTTTQLQ